MKRLKFKKSYGMLSTLLATYLLLALLGGCLPGQGVSSKEKDSKPGCADLKIPEDMRCIPAGTFIRGSDRLSRDENTGKMVRDEAPPATIELSLYFMDLHEVTYSEYQSCVRAGGCSHSEPYYKGYSHPKQPMLGMTWYQARDYCAWKGRRLPTEAEWEKASRGPNGDLYPWGNEEATCKEAIIQEGGEKTGKGCHTGKTWDVMSRPAYRYGLYDMAGNSWEWVQDWYSKDYASCGADCLGKDPKGPCQGADRCPGHAERVVRGGSWWWDGPYSLGSNRRHQFPKNRPYHHLGFRCAKTPAL